MPTGEELVLKEGKETTAAEGKFLAKAV